MKQVTNLQNPFLEGCLTCAIYTVMNIKCIKSSIYCTAVITNFMEQHIYQETSSVFLFHELNQYCEVMDRLMQGSKLTLKVNGKIDQF